MTRILGLDGAPLAAASFVSGAPVVERTRVHARTPDPAWVERLAALTPRSEVMTWLHLAWEPGDPWPGHEVERWALWIAKPPAMLDPAVLKELRGPAPRSTGHYCGPTSLCGHDPRRRPDQWVGGACRLIDQREWELYRETGAWCRRWWIIEGTNGGHLYRYTDAQRAFMRATGLPPDPPVAGSLPYAEPDEQTWTAVAEHDRFRQTHGRLLERSAAELDAEERDEAIRVRTAIAEWFRRQAAEAVEIGGSDLRRQLAEYRRPSWQAAPEPDYDAEDEAFVHDVD